MSHKLFMLYSNCIPVRGISESIICDVERRAFLPVVNELFEILEKNQDLSLPVSLLKKHYKNKYDNGIDAFFNYLEKLGYGFYTDEPENFPSLSMEWEVPFKLTNAVITVSRSSFNISKDAVRDIVSIGCLAIELIFYDDTSIDEIVEFIGLIKNSKTSCVHLCFKWNINIRNEEIISLFSGNMMIGKIIIHSSTEDHFVPGEFPSNMKNIIQQTRKHPVDLLIPNCSKHGLVLNISSFIEANSYNLGLNKRICIDINGDVKNDFSHTKVFGNINDQQICDIVNRTELCYLWNINKNLVEKCKDCQYRYMCVDFSDIKFEEGKYYTINECQFDPYNNKWQSREY